MEGEDSFETIADGDEHMEPVEDDGSTFTFAADASTAGAPDHESVGDEQDPEFAEDATIAKLFRSPLKQTSSTSNASPE